MKQHAELDRLELPTAEAAQRLREWFTSIDYTAAGLAELFDCEETPIPSRSNLPAIMSRIQDPTPRHLMARWFVAGVDESLEAAQTLLGDEPLQRLQASTR